MGFLNFLISNIIIAVICVSFFVFCVGVEGLLENKFKDKALAYLNDRNELKHDVVEKVRTIRRSYGWWLISAMFVFIVLAWLWVPAVINACILAVLIIAIIFIGDIADEYYLEHLDDFKIHDETSNATQDDSDDASKDDDRNAEDTTDYSERIFAENKDANESDSDAEHDDYLKREDNEDSEVEENNDGSDVSTDDETTPAVSNDDTVSADDANKDDSEFKGTIAE